MTAPGAPFSLRAFNEDVSQISNNPRKTRTAAVVANARVAQAAANDVNDEQIQYAHLSPALDPLKLIKLALIQLTEIKIFSA
jgi:hypothetical protein